MTLVNTEKDFWSNVQKSEGCWLWTGNISSKGYGRFGFNGKIVSAHRFAYEKLKGAIPEDLQIDHLCRNHACVNPDHLEVVTSKENTLRGEGPSAKLARRTHCPNGHPFEGDNLDKYQRSKGARRCRICNNEYHRRWAQSKKDASNTIGYDKATGMGETSKLSRARPDSPSLKTTVPPGIISALKLEAKDEIEWNIEVRDNKIIVEIKKK